MLKLVIVIAIFLLASCSTNTHVDSSPSDENISEEKLIVQSVENNRDHIIEKYLPDTHSEPRSKAPTHIVLHFSSNVVENIEDPYNIEDIYQIYSDYEVSAHYVIERAGTVYQLVDEKRIAYHAGQGHLPDLPDYTDRLNHYSVGIELLAIGSKEEMEQIVPQVEYSTIDPTFIGYTEEQYTSLHTLLKDIIHRNPSITFDRNHIIGHDEYTDRKVDPGELFDWSKIDLSTRR